MVASGVPPPIDPPPIDLGWGTQFIADEGVLAGVAESVDNISDRNGLNGTDKILLKISP